MTSTILAEQRVSTATLLKAKFNMTHPFKPLTNKAIEFALGYNK